MRLPQKYLFIRRIPLPRNTPGIPSSYRSEIILALIKGTESFRQTAATRADSISSAMMFPSELIRIFAAESATASTQTNLPLASKTEFLASRFNSSGELKFSAEDKVARFKQGSNGTRKTGVDHQLGTQIRQNTFELILIPNPHSEPINSNLLRIETSKDQIRFGKALGQPPFERHPLLPERKSHQNLEHGLRAVNSGTSAGPGPTHFVCLPPESPRRAASQDALKPPGIDP